MKWWSNGIQQVGPRSDLYRLTVECGHRAAGASRSENMLGFQAREAVVRIRAAHTEGSTA